MNNTLVTLLVLAVIAIVGWLAYSQGYFNGTEEQSDSVEIKLGGSSDSN